MSESAQSEEQLYRVVVNHEEQYSIWPAERELPPGWRDEGTSGPKAQCLDHIEQVWTDMRPLSLRRHMETEERRLAESPPEPEPEEVPYEPLVQRLATGTHPVRAGLRPEESAAALGEAVQRGFVFVKFTETRGGTELGMELDREASDLGDGALDRGEGSVRLVGDLVLDYVPVRCIANLDVATLAGEGHLEIRDQAR
jgi:uncharacterized protein YbdZ (MbtH family)